MPKTRLSRAASLVPLLYSLTSMWRTLQGLPRTSGNLYLLPKTAWIRPTCCPPRGPNSLAAGAESGGRASVAVKQDTKQRREPLQELDLNPPRGTRDFYPEEMRLRNWLFDHWRSVAEIYAFEEYDAPALESEALYVRKAGEEVTEQLYNFEDKGGRRVALRPEMTPSLARMVMAKRNGLTMPIKWFSIPQCWRYERTTRGRRREHYQWNMDIWSVTSVAAEAELLSAITTFLLRIGLTSADVGIKINSRGMLAELLSKLGVSMDKFAATCILIDKLEKMPLDAVMGDFEALSISNATVLKLVEVLKVRHVEDLEHFIGADSPTVKQLRQLYEYAQAFGFEDWLIFDASVVRGLAYYTGLVFEAFDRAGKFRAICGGGRYDRLLETFGGESLSAAGFGFGDAVIMELLDSKGLRPKLPRGLCVFTLHASRSLTVEFAADMDIIGVDVLVFAMDGDLQTTAITTAQVMRGAALSVDLQLEAKKPKWVFKHADRIGAGFVVAIGSKEAADGKVQIRDMFSGLEEAVAVSQLNEWIAQQKKAR